MKSKLFKYVILIVIIVAIVGGTVWFINYRKGVEEQEKLEQIKNIDVKAFEKLNFQSSYTIDDYQAANAEYIVNQAKTYTYPEFINEINQAIKPFSKFENSLVLLNTLYTDTKKFENNTNIDPGIYMVQNHIVTTHLEICNNAFYSCIEHYNSQVDLYNKWVKELISDPINAEYVRSKGINELYKYTSKVCTGYIDVNNDNIYNGKSQE